MKTSLLFALCISCFTLSAGSIFADIQVEGYQKHSGANVGPYMRTNPNSTKSDNYSTKGNTNPYTGKHGSH